MQPVIRDMAQWAIGFALVSTLYLMAGLWLIRRHRANRAGQGDAGQGETGQGETGPQKSGQSDTASSTAPSNRKDDPKKESR